MTISTKSILIFLMCIELIACKHENNETIKTNTSSPDRVSLIILGNVQDAGSPHIACKKNCCKNLFLNPDQNRKVVALGLIDTENDKNYILEATPDFGQQLKHLKTKSNSNQELPDGIFLTHAHIGHYTGLMYLGKEATNAKNVAVFAMPKMKTFLASNGPWDQLVENNNINIQELNDQKEIILTTNIKVIPIQVPHRDEYSETVGYKIVGPNKTALFIPDIDKWEKWSLSIIEAVSNVDLAFLDATFYDAKEVNNRNISEIPHPFVIETMGLFEKQSAEEKSKIYFIHMNHTNPLLNPKSKETNHVLDQGFNIARMSDVFEL